MNYHYFLYNNFDEEKKNPIAWGFNTPPSVDDEFDHNGITYKVLEVDIETPYAVVRVIKEKIPNKNSWFIHNCTATGTRIRMQGHYAQKCPHCGVEFYKDSVEFPEEVEIESAFTQEERNG